MENINLSLGIFFAVGAILIPIWRKKKKEKKQWLLYEFLWSLICFGLYLIALEIQSRTFLLLIPLAFFFVFFIPYKLERRRLINGLLFNIFLISFGIYLGLLALATQSYLLFFLLGGILILLILLLMIGLYALILFLYWNALIVWKREGHSLANLLTLLLAIGLTLFLVLSYISGQYLPTWAAALFAILPTMIVYFAIVFYNFLTISVIYQFNRPTYNQHYIIVLGAGLIEGKNVSPLLGKRIERAIHFYDKQKQQKGTPPKLLMSGGKGDDEHLAESLAMKAYALELGVPEEDVLIEAHSTTTLENMRFSKEIMEKDFGSSSYNAIFSTNNFHLFRAGLYARQAGLNANGIGAKTALYYLPNAFLREFAAVVLMRKRRHMIICGLIVVFNLLIALFEVLASVLIQ